MNEHHGGSRRFNLQELQRQFDRDRDLDFERAVSADPQIGGRSVDRWLHNLEFATLALAGEVGELANLVKKARRQLWRSEDPALDVPAAKSELADIVSYALKFANLADWDVEEAYLEKLSENYLRFADAGPGEAAPVISVAGPPGSGKTSTVTALLDGRAAYMEASAENPFLTQAGRAAAIDVAASQTWFLERITNFVAGTDPSTELVIDQDPAAIVKVYGRSFRRAGELSAPAYKELLAQLLELESRLSTWATPRLVVLLDAPAETLFARTRSRVEERQPTREWLNEIRTGFLEFGASVPGAVVIDTRERDIEQVTELIESVLAERYPASRAGS